MLFIKKKINLLYQENEESLLNDAQMFVFSISVEGTQGL